MCGIFCILDIKSEPKVRRDVALQQVKLLRHRGPDWSGIFSDDHAVLAHERLAIVDTVHGAQPLFNKSTGAALAVNGEIYNHQDLRAELKNNHQFQTNSDCEIILYLYQEYGLDCVKYLNGIFAFVLYDPRQKTFIVARDHIGIVPLYIGFDQTGTMYVASEMKALLKVCDKIEEFPPGHIYEGKLGKEVGKFHKYYNPDWAKPGNYPKNKYDPAKLRNAMTKAIERQLMSDVPYGLLISGGVDSSIIAAVAAQFKDKRIETHGESKAWWPQLHSFSIGLQGSPDTAAAKKVADFIGTVHHEIEFTEQQGLDALSEVIYHLETFDVTTIRASTPMYLLSRWIKSMGIKMVLSGEGADEIFGGYLYFHKAPNAQEFHDETVRKLNALHQFDCLRANKSTAAWGLEVRVPFLDKEFLEVAMNIDPAEKMIQTGKIEKQILREAFQGYLPDEVLWRQKEQFSDGVGYGWIDTLKKLVEEKVSDKMLQEAAKTFPEKTPTSKEEYYYRSIFAKHFAHPFAARCVPVGPSIACSTPTAIKWDKSFASNADPSGRAIKTIHKDSYK